MSLLMVAGFYSIMMAARRLARPGISREIRWRFLTSHIVVVVMFILIQNLQTFYYSFVVIEPRPVTKKEINWRKNSELQTFSMYVSIFSGLILGAIRLLDS